MKALNNSKKSSIFTQQSRFMLKRFFDIFGAIIGITILFPLLLFIAIWIVIDTKGNPLFYQQRVGKNNTNFTIFKFRTMHNNAQQQGALTLGDKDPRITTSGVFLRKYKLDELPQLFNVLFGSMSFVGPRPELRKYVDLYSESDKNILTLKPGITDYASIIFRNEAELLKAAKNPDNYYIKHIIPEKIKLNKLYLANNNILIDFKIIIKTLKTIIN